MKSVKFLVLLLMVFCLATTAGAQTKKSNAKSAKQASAAFVCPMKCEGDKTYAKASKCPVCNMALSKVQKETAAYKCPMKCEGDKTYTKAGKCAVCNMNLAKVEAKKATTGHEGHNHN